MTVNELSVRPPLCLSLLHPRLLFLLESYEANCLYLRLSFTGWLLNVVEKEGEKQREEVFGGC